MKNTVLGRRNCSREPERLQCAAFRSPLGELMLVANQSALVGVYFIGCDHVPMESKTWLGNAKHPILLRAIQELTEYFAGKRKAFSLPLQFVGTEFQKKIWNQIARIPHGKTMSYAELARLAGSPKAIRAAGTSTGRNPISIIVPCHRVVGKGGDLCGFAGGLHKKRFLLALESGGQLDFRAD
jgi:methylated-DNA-[protein]-cysteine S-methyltransferase